MRSALVQLAFVCGLIGLAVGLLVGQANHVGYQAPWAGAGLGVLAAPLVLLLTRNPRAQFWLLDVGLFVALAGVTAFVGLASRSMEPQFRILYLIQTLLCIAIAVFKVVRRRRAVRAG